MSFLTMPVHVGVVTAPEWAEIHRNYGPLLTLAQIKSFPSPAPQIGVHHGSGSDEEAMIISPVVASPVTSVEAARLAELMAPATVTFQHTLPNEELTFYLACATRYSLKEAAERAYVALVFQEYRKRKSVEEKWQQGIDEMRDTLCELQSRELPPALRAALDGVASEEQQQRCIMEETRYPEFVAWVVEKMPLWLQATEAATEERLKREEATRKALAAAKAALAEELAQGKTKLLRTTTTAPAASTVVVAPSPSECNDMQSGYEAVQRLQQILGPSTHGAASGAQRVEEGEEEAQITPSALRRKAIKMLEDEETQIKQRREEQLRRLKADEDALRAKLAEREAEAEAVRQAEIVQRVAALTAQESQLRARLNAREDEHAAKERGRREMLEHIAAEEELLRRRLADQEARRAASAEEAARQEAIRKRELYEQLKTQEDELRRRVQQREQVAEAARKAQMQEQEERERQARELKELQTQQEEALRSARESHAREEREKQLSYLKEQEELYKRRMREKELEEIRAREAQMRQRMDEQQQHLSQLQQQHHQQHYDPQRTSSSLYQQQQQQQQPPPQQHQQQWSQSPQAQVPPAVPLQSPYYPQLAPTSGVYMVPALPAQPAYQPPAPVLGYQMPTAYSPATAPQQPIIYAAPQPYVMQPYYHR